VQHGLKGRHAQRCPGVSCPQGHGQHAPGRAETKREEQENGTIASFLNWKYTVKLTSRVYALCEIWCEYRANFLQNLRLFHIIHIISVTFAVCVLLMLMQGFPHNNYMLTTVLSCVFTQTNKLMVSIYSERLCCCLTPSGDGADQEGKIRSPPGRRAAVYQVQDHLLPVRCHLLLQPRSSGLSAPHQRPLLLPHHQLHTEVSPSGAN